MGHNHHAYTLAHAHSHAHTHTQNTHSGSNSIRLFLPPKSYFSFIKRKLQNSPLVSLYLAISVTLIAATIDISRILVQQRSRAASQSGACTHTPAALQGPSDSNNKILWPNFQSSTVRCVIHGKLRVMLQTIEIAG